MFVGYKLWLLVLIEIYVGNILQRERLVLCPLGCSVGISVAFGNQAESEMCLVVGRVHIV